MRTDLTIEIFVLAEKATGVSKVVYFSHFVPAGQTMDIFVSETNRLIALFHHEAFSDPLLKARRDQHKMVYPGSKNNEKLILVGQVYGVLHIDPTTHIEVSRAPLRLWDIPVDEQ